VTVFDEFGTNLLHEIIGVVVLV